MKQIFFLTACAALFAGQLFALESDSEVAAAPDKKVAAWQTYGLREAIPLAENKIQLTIGTAVGTAIHNPLSYRIVSFDDPNYAYEKFVRPAKANVTNSSSLTEITAPDGFQNPSAANFNRLKRHFVELILPFPLVKGKRYAVVAIGSGSDMVTAAKTAADFVYDGPRPERTPSYQDVKALTCLGLRGVSSVGNGVLLLEFGHLYSVPAGNSIANYSVSVNGKAAKITAFGRRSLIDAYQPTGWPFQAYLKNDVFLELDTPLSDGDAVRVTVAPSVTSGANSSGFTFDSKKSISNAIKVNQVGYIASSPVKRAHLGHWFGSMPDSAAVFPGGGVSDSAAVSNDAFFDTVLDSGAKTAATPKPAGKKSKKDLLSPGALRFEEPPEFEILSAADGKSVYHGKAKLAHNGRQNDGKANHSAENVYYLDFGDFKTPGKYFIRIASVGRSFDFEIADNIYEKAFDAAAHGLFLQRCGQKLEPPFSDWHRIACHAKGVTVSSCKRSEYREWGKFEENLVSIPNKKGASDAHKAIIKDPALVAYYPMEGNFNDKTGRNNLTPNATGADFPVDGSVTGKASDRVYTTGDSGNGATGNLAVDPAKGLTVSFFFRKTGGIKYDGKLIELGGFSWWASWGIPMTQMYGGRLGYKRVDAKWHNYTWTIQMAAPGKVDAKGRKTAPLWRARFFVDGEFSGDAEGSGYMEKTKLTFAALTRDDAAGASFDELRVYNRILRENEIAALAEKNSPTIPLVLETSGGHHDAGDYNPRCHIDVAQVLLNAYEVAPQKFFDNQLNIPEKNNGIPDIVDEALWSLKVWLGLQDPSDGGVYNGTESQGDPNFIQTVELDNKGDYAWAKDSCGSLLFAGTMAQASRILKSLGKTQMAADYLERAERAFRWGKAHKPETKNAVTYGNFYVTPLAYAAGQLLHTTGKPQYLDDLKANCVWSRNPNAELSSWRKYDQSDVAYTIMLCPESLMDKGLRTAAVKAICREADMYIDGSNKMAYKFLRHPFAPISWGTGAYENNAYVAAMAWKASDKEKYREWMIRSADNTLGNNPLNISWIVGLGTKTVRAPLHNSRYNPSGMVVPGMQVQGPSERGDGYQYTATAYPKHQNGSAVLYSFLDCHWAIAMDEGTTPNQVKTMAVFGLLLPDCK